MKRIATICAAVMLGGCLNRQHPVTLPDGTAGHTITRCRSLEKCMAVAQKVCGGPYDIKSQSESFNSGFTLLVDCKVK